MLRHSIALSILTAIATPTFAAAPQTLGGGTGLGIMHNADILAGGEYALSLGLGIASYDTPGASSISATPSFAMGFADMGEVYLSAPYLSVKPDVGDDITGMGDTRIGAKFAISQPEGNGLATAVSLFAGFGNGDDELTSGDSSYGVELNLSNWYDGGGLHFNIGYEESDALGANEAHGKITAGLGIEHALSGSTTLYAQSNAFIDRDDDNDENLLVALGLHYSPSNDFGMQVGYGRGVPDGRSEPESLVFASITYSPGSSPSRYAGYNDPQRIKAVEGQQSQLDSRVDNLNSRVHDMDERIARIESVATVEGVTFPTNARIEVVKASGNPEVVNRIMGQLKEANARITQVRSLDGVKEDTTWIKYRAGLSDAAIAVGHSLDGNQIVVQRPLPPGVDIQIVIGNTLGPR